MNERPILFSGPMVRALLDGTKTQTRRVVKPQPKHLSPVRPYHRPNGEWAWVLAETGMGSGVTTDGFNCPYGHVGDLLYVRETWHKVFEYPKGHNESIEYRADGHGLLPGHRWKPSIHMPKKFARIWLEVTDVRVERVQEISDGDVGAEGIQHIATIGLSKLYRSAHNTYCGPKEGFSVLWDTLNEKRGYGWDVNPWVWVLTFKRIER